MKDVPSSTSPDGCAITVLVLPGATIVMDYPKGVPDYADTVAQDGSLVITVGRPVKAREQRQVTLLEGQK